MTDTFLALEGELSFLSLDLGEDGGALLVVRDTAPIVTLVESPVGVLVAPAGQGPAGPPGTDAASVLPLIAAVTVGAHLIVRPIGSITVGPASASNLADADAAIGMAVTAANAGGSLSIQVSGLVIEPTWSWEIGPVYLAVDGALTQAPGIVGGFIQQVGVAVAPTQIVLGLRPAIILS